MPLAHIHLDAFFLTAQLTHDHRIGVLLTGDAADG
jgi:hypothetical protein